MARDRKGIRGVPAVRLLWWPVLTAVWFLFVGEWSWQVALWGAALAGVAAVAADVMGRQGLSGARIRWRWWREALSAAWGVPVGFAVVTAALVSAIAARRRSEIGAFHGDLSAAGPEPRQAGRRAWDELAGTWSPSCYVIDIDPESDRRLIHELRPLRSSELPR